MPQPIITVHQVDEGTSHGLELLESAGCDRSGMCQRAVVAALVVGGLAAYTSPAAESVDEPAARHIVLIGFDGFDLDHLGRASTPNTNKGQSRRTPLPTIADAVVDGGGTVGAVQYFILQGNGTDYGDPNALYTQPGGACSRRFDDVGIAESTTIVLRRLNNTERVGHHRSARRRCLIRRPVAGADDLSGARRLRRRPLSGARCRACAQAGRRARRP